MKILKDLINKFNNKNIGPTRTFSELQIVRAILLLGEHKVLGRTLLARKLNIGTGAVRTIINDFEKLNIIFIGKKGCQLSKKGILVYQELIRKITQVSLIDAGHLSIDKISIATHVKNAGRQVGNGLRQRDEAIRAGATGATSLIYRNNKFVIPMGSDDCDKDFPDNVWSLLRKIFDLENEDVIIISNAKDKDSAIYGGFASALSLIR